MHLHSEFHGNWKHFIIIDFKCIDNVIEIQICSTVLYPFALPQISNFDQTIAAKKTDDFYLYLQQWKTAFIFLYFIIVLWHFDTLECLVDVCHRYLIFHFFPSRIFCFKPIFYSAVLKQKDVSYILRNSFFAKKNVENVF